MNFTTMADLEGGYTENLDGRKTMGNDANRSACNAGYEGVDRRNYVERRIGERRSEECIYHEAHEARLQGIDKKQNQFEEQLKGVFKALDGKVSFKLFYILLMLVIGILAFQWTTYEMVHDIALTHVKADGATKLELEKLTSTIEQNHIKNTMDLNQLKSEIAVQGSSTSRNIDELSNQIDRIHELINEKHGGGKK